MKIRCLEMSEVLYDSIEKVLGILNDSRKVNSVEDADMVIAMSLRDIETKWNKFPHKCFIVITNKKSLYPLPQNVHEVLVANVLRELVEVIHLHTSVHGPDRSDKTVVRPDAPKGAPRVLVVDDTPMNIQSAIETIPAGYALTTATSYAEAMEIIDASAKKPFDVVLTDLHMPMPSLGLSSEAWQLGALISCGLLIFVEALAKGTKSIAVVTDLGHHDDPFSSAFGHFTHEAIKTGDTSIRLLHAPLRPDGSKDWGKVLED